MSNILKIFDKYASEDYLCRRTKPRGMLRCEHCHEYYEPVYDDFVEATVCSYCGEISMTYEEE